MVIMDMVDRQFDPCRGKTGAVDMNITGASDHDPEFERVIRTVK